MRRPILGLSVVLALSAAPVRAASDAALASIQKQIDALRADYETRLEDLEQRLVQAEDEAKQARSSAAAAEQAASAAARPAGGSATSASAMNPAVSAVLQGSALSYSRDPEHWHLRGFQTGDEAAPRAEGLGLDETELSLYSNVDDWLYGQATMSLHQEQGDTSVSLEEVYADALGLPGGLGLRFGRFFSDIGYLNSHHSHVWDFADAPLAYRAFLGGQYGDDGVRLTWLAPTDLYLELGVEALRGDEFPGGGGGTQWLGSTHTAFAHLGGDLGASNSWSLGLSGLWASPDARTSASGRGQAAQFDGDSDLSIGDLVWKWAPDGDATRRNFTFQTEYFYRHENGLVTPGPDLGGGVPFGPVVGYDGDQQGLYVQGVYQFIPRWRLGLRYDRLWADNGLSLSDPAARLQALGAVVADPSAGVLGKQWLGQRQRARQLLASTGLVDGEDPSRWTLMLDYSHSEFSRIRLQYALDDSTGKTDQQWTLQYILTLGAHGAHSY